MLHLDYHIHFKKKDMKKIIQLLTLCLLITSCDFQKVTDLQEDFEIKVSAEPVLSKISFKIFDANAGKDIASSVKIDFTGPDADKIYTVNGSKSLKVENGFITVGINRNFPVSKENPLTVTASISADGYMPKERVVTFDGDDIREVQVSLLKQDELPESTVLEKVTQGLSGNATTSEISVSVTSNRNSEETSDFTLPTGTTFYDEDDNLITGTSLTADLQIFDSESSNEEDTPTEEQNPESFNSGENEFPGGLNLDGDFSKSETKNGSLNKKLVQNYLVPVTSLGCYYLYVNGRRVYRFSNPLLVRNYIYRNAINPITGLPVKLGDAVSVFYYNRSTRTKDKLSTAIVKRDGRGFYVEFLAPRSGVYPVGFEVNFNHSCTSINSIKFVNNGRRTFYRYYVAHKSNPRRAIRYGYMYFDGTKEVTDNSLNYWSNRGLSFLGEDMVLKIYYYSRSSRRYSLVYDQEVSVCELDGQTIDISNTDCFEERDLDLSLDCPDATYLLSNLYVYHKKESDRYWSYFDRVSNSRLNGKSPCLEAGVKYQFAFWYGGWKITPPLTEAEMLNLYQNFDLPTICKAIKDL
jgi:hypothetical protein